MKTRFWNVGIEFYEDGQVLAAVLRSREAENQPRDSYRNEPRREVFSLWYETEASAQSAVFEALAMGGKQEAAA